MVSGIGIGMSECDACRQTGRQTPHSVQIGDAVAAKRCKADGP